jgi:phosphonate transport system substrate-binding protein
VDVAFYNDGDWQERERLLDQCRVEGAFICGLPYTLKVDRAKQPPIELLAAPIMAGERYGGRAVYYSDVIVHRDSPVHSFEDLRAASWAYNDPGSFSGHLVTCYELARRGEGCDYFGALIQSGSHLRSIDMVLDGRVQASAIDSTVLELACRFRPEIATGIRVVAVFGPAPIPPAVVLAKLPAGLKQNLREQLCRMHQRDDGRAVLATGGVARFPAVTDADYDPIRHMARVAASVTLEQ